MGDRAFATHAVEVELEVAGLGSLLPFSPTRISTSLSGLIERIRFSFVRSLHSTLTNLGAMASVFADTRLRSKSSKVMKAMDSRWNNEPVASEVNLTNLEVGVEQEETFAHGAQDVFRLLAGGRGGRSLFAACQ